MRFKINKGQKGIALGMVLIFLLAMTASLGIWYKSSENFQKTKASESSVKVLEISTQFHLENIRTQLTKFINQLMQARAEIVETGYSDSLIDKHFEEGNWRDEVKKFYKARSRSGEAGTTSQLPRFASSFLYDPDENNEFRYTINCILNCNSLQVNPDGFRAYPKRFSIRITEMKTGNDAILMTLDSLIDIQPANINNFSTVLTGVSDEKVIFGAGIHRKEGVFFDMTAFEARNPGKEPKIQFLNPVDSLLEFEKLVTNLDEMGLEFGASVPTGCCGAQTHTNVGEINFKEGLLTGSSPANDLVSNVQDLISDETTFKSALPANAEVERCEIQMSCENPPTCEVSVMEYQVGDPNPVYLVQDLDGDGDGNPNTNPDLVADNLDPPNNSVFFTTANRCLLMPQDGSSVAYYGTKNMTFIANGSFFVRSSVAPVESINENERGGALFVSLESDAIVMDEQTLSLITNQTLGDIYEASGLSTETVSLVLKLGAISLAERPEATVRGAVAFKLSDNLLTPGGQMLGTLERDGPAISPEMNALRGFSNGNFVSGFEKVDTIYSSHWLTRPPRGMDAQSAVEHQSVIIAIANRSASLRSALADVGLEWQEAPAASASGEGGP